MCGLFVVFFVGLRYSFATETYCLLGISKVGATPNTQEVGVVWELPRELRKGVGS